MTSSSFASWVAEEVLHHREPAAHHRRGERGSAPVAVAPDAVHFPVGPVVGEPHFLAGRRDAEVGGDAAAVRKARDLPAVRAERHHRDGVPLEFLHVGEEAGQDADRDGFDPAVHAVFDAGGAAVAVLVSRRPDEDRLLGGVRLGQGRDRLREVRAEVLLGVAVDDAFEAEAEVQDVEVFSRVAPDEHRPEDLGEPGVRLGECFDGDRVVNVVRTAERDRPHGEVRAPGDPVGGVRVGVLSTRRDARHRGAVGSLFSGVSDRAEQELLVDRLALEDRVVHVDAGVDHPDGHAGARRDVRTLQQVRVPVGAVGVDRVESPLRLEIAVRGVVLRELRRHGVELRRGHALAGVDRHAGVSRRVRQVPGRRDWRIRLGRRLRRPGRRRRSRGRRGRYRGARHALGRAAAEREQKKKTGKSDPDHRSPRYRMR